MPSRSFLHLNGAKKLYCKLTLLKAIASSFPLSLFIFFPQTANTFFTRIEFEHSTINELYIFTIVRFAAWLDRIFRLCLVSYGKQVLRVDFLIMWEDIKANPKEKVLLMAFKANRISICSLRDGNSRHFPSPLGAPILMSDGFFIIIVRIIFTYGKCQKNISPANATVTRKICGNGSRRTYRENRN